MSNPAQPAAINFDARTVAPTQAMDPVPGGWYNIKIVESTMKPTKDGNGAYLELTEEILDGQFAGRKLWDRLNIENQNASAKEIAYRTLSAICHATGVMLLTSSAQLHGIPLMAKVSVKPARTEGDKTYEATNEVKGYKAIEGGAGVPTTPPVAAPVATPAPAAAPWASQPAPSAPVPAPAAPAPAPAPAAPAVRMNPPPPYQEGDVVNGYQLKSNQWVPYVEPPPPAPPAPPAAPPPPPNGGWTPPPAAAPGAPPAPQQYATQPPPPVTSGGPPWGGAPAPASPPAAPPAPASGPPPWAK